MYKANLSTCTMYLFVHMYIDHCVYPHTTLQLRKVRIYFNKNTIYVLLLWSSSSLVLVVVVVVVVVAGTALATIVLVFGLVPSADLHAPENWF